MQNLFVRYTFLLLNISALFFVNSNRGICAENQPQLQVQVGLAGTYKVGCWTEVRIEAEGDQNQQYLAEVEVIDADGNLVQFQSAAFRARANGKISVAVPVHIGRIHTRFTARLFEISKTKQPKKSSPTVALKKLVAEHRVSPDETTELTQFQPLYVAVGKVGEISVTQQFVDKLHVQELKTLSELPVNTLCWQGIDSLIYEGKKLDGPDAGAAIERLIEWTQSGGRLIVFPGTDAEAFMMSHLAKSLPVTFSGIAQVRDFSRLESYVEEPARIRNRTAFTIPRVTQFDGISIVESLSGPLVIRCPWGFGRVTVIGINLNHKNFQQWQALPQLYRMLAELPEIGEKKTKTNSKLLTQAGLTDLKTQWDAALSNFHFRTPSVWIPLGYLLLAALLVGPFDYFLVRHILKRPWMTWFTFPILIALLAFWGINGVASQYSITSNQYSISSKLKEKQMGDSEDAVGNQCLVIDYAADVKRERHFGYVKLFCEETGRYDIESEIEIPLENARSTGLFTPAAIPEQSFRGYYRESGIHLDQAAYQVSPLKMESLSTPIYNRSTVLFEITGSNKIGTPKVNSEATTEKEKHKKKTNTQVIEHQLASSGRNQLGGKLTYRLNVPLSNWILAYGKLIYYVDSENSLAELNSGETIQLPSLAVNQKEFTAFMTGKTTQAVKRKTGVGEDMLVRRKNYDPFSSDLTSILRTTTFHETIGGQQYTSLTNIDLISWDFSPLLKLNRAILIGQLKQPFMETRVNGQVVKTFNDSSYLRIVIPVEQDIAEIDRLPDYGKEKEALRKGSSQSESSE